MSTRAVLRYFFIATLFSSIGCMRTHAASFDCKNAKTDTEKAICADAQLSGRDDEMARAYREAMARATKGVDKKALQEQQREWLAKRDARCEIDVVCLKTRYGERIEALTKETGALQKSSKVVGAKQAAGAKNRERHRNFIDVVNRYFPANDSRFGSSSVGEFCAALLDDLRRGQNVSFVDPIAESDDPNDPAFARYQNSSCRRDTNQVYIESFQSLQSIGDYDYRLYHVSGLELIFARMKVDMQWGANAEKSGGFYVVDFDQCVSKESVGLSVAAERKISEAFIVRRGGQHFAVVAESIGNGSLLVDDIRLTARIIRKSNWKDACTFGSYMPTTNAIPPANQKKH